jgi:hypothetical protein
MTEKRSYVAYVVWITMSITLMLIFSLNCFGEELPITPHQQLQDQWCWTACSESVLNYYGSAAQQCQMANYAFGQTNCCNNVVWPNGTGPLCDQRNFLANWLDIIWGSKSAQSVIKHFGKVDSSYRPWAVSASTLKDQISAKAPWIMGWKWTDEGGHVLLGYGLSGTMVSYMDPWPYSTTLNRYDYERVKS